MTYSQHRTKGAINAQSPFFLKSLRQVFESKYLQECARLAEKQPTLDDEELEARAMETVMFYFYLMAKDRLPFYLVTVSWRADLK